LAIQPGSSGTNLLLTPFRNAISLPDQTRTFTSGIAKAHHDPGAHRRGCRRSGVIQGDWSSFFVPRAENSMEIFLALLTQPIAIAFWARWLRGFPVLATILTLMVANVLVANIVGEFYPAGVRPDQTPDVETVAETLSPIPDLDLHLALLTLCVTGGGALLVVGFARRRRAA